MAVQLQRALDAGPRSVPDRSGRVRGKALKSESCLITHALRPEDRGALRSITHAPTQNILFISRLSDMKKQLVLETASLILRRFVQADTPKMFRMSQEEGMRTWLHSQVYRDEAHAASVLAFLISQYDTGTDPRIAPLVLGIQLRTTGELIGHVGLSALGESVEVGFAIERCHQRKGFATEAVRAICKWATTELPIQTILGITAIDNIASQGVLLRAGFLRAKEKIMRFQGSEQTVIVFEFSAQPPACQ